MSTNRKDAFYFPHDSNAHADERILELRAEFGWEGYGIYWALVERMRDASDYRIRNRARKAIALGLSIDAKLFDDIVELCIEVGLFDSDDDHFWSPALERRMAEVENKRKRRQAAGAKGGKSKKNGETSKQSSSNEPPPPEDEQALLNQCSSNAQALLPNDATNAEAMLKQCQAKKGKDRKEEERRIEERGEAEVFDAREAQEEIDPPEPGPPPRRESSRPPKPPPRFATDSATVSAIYDAFPKKKAKQAALKSIAKVLDGGFDPERLLEATTAFAKHWLLQKAEDPDSFQFCPYPATWYNGGGYDDDRSDWRSDERPTRQPAGNNGRDPQQPDAGSGKPHRPESPHQRRANIGARPVGVERVQAFAERFYGVGQGAAGDGVEGAGEDGAGSGTHQ